MANTRIVETTFGKGTRPEICVVTGTPDQIHAFERAKWHEHPSGATSRWEVSEWLEQHMQRLTTPPLTRLQQLTGTVAGQQCKYVTGSPCYLISKEQLDEVNQMLRQLQS